MPKSMPRPTNSGMKATEMRLKRWKIRSPQALAAASPMSIVTNIATMRRGDRTAIQSIVTIATNARAAISPAPWLSDPNSSSSSGADPVRRTVTPCAASRPRALAACRTKSVGSAPGCNLV
jgi:hypothetical protein